jgi:hypothetical protein
MQEIVAPGLAGIIVAALESLENAVLALSGDTLAAGRGLPQTQTISRMKVEP